MPSKSVSAELGEGSWGEARRGREGERRDVATRAEKTERVKNPPVLRNEVRKAPLGSMGNPGPGLEPVTVVGRLGMLDPIRRGVKPVTSPGPAPV
jgi:hypothetical protein